MPKRVTNPRSKKDRSRPDGRVNRNEEAEEPTSNQGPDGRVPKKNETTRGNEKKQLWHNNHLGSEVREKIKTLNKHASDDDLLTRSTSELSLNENPEAGSNPLHQEILGDEAPMEQEDPYGGGTEHSPYPDPEPIHDWAKHVEDISFMPTSPFMPDGSDSQVSSFPILPVGSDSQASSFPISPVGSVSQLSSHSLPEGSVSQPTLTKNPDSESNNGEEQPFIQVVKKQQTKTDKDGDYKAERGTKRSAGFAAPKLPKHTSSFHTHPWIHIHPLGKYLKPRIRNFSTLNSENTTQKLDPQFYNHLPPSGYSQSGTVRKLFPLKEWPNFHSRYQLPFMEFPGIAEATEFLVNSQTVYDSLKAKTLMRDDRKQLPMEPEGSRPSCVVPIRYKGILPVIYQVIELRGQNAVCKSKDFLVCQPRRDLHCIILDMMALNIRSGNRGYSKSNLSNKDHLYVYSVEPTTAAWGDAENIFANCSKPRAATLDQDRKYFWRVKEFVFVEAHSVLEERLGVVLSVPPEGSGAKNKTVRAAFEGAPEVVKISKAQCKNEVFLANLKLNDLISGTMRKNISTSIRLSEPPASKEALKELALLVRDFIPAYAEEGITPLNVSGINNSTLEWVEDRVQDFKLFDDSPETLVRIARSFNFGCSAIAAHARLQDDRRMHDVEMRTLAVSHFPLRCTFIIPELSGAAGWEKGRTVLTWIHGANFGANATVRNYRTMAGKSVEITVEFQGREASHVSEAIQAKGVSMAGATGSVGSFRTDVRVRLNRTSAVADPVFELVSREDLLTKADDVGLKNLFNLLYNKNLAEASVPNIIYNRTKATATLVKGAKLSFSKDQKEAIALGCANQKIAAIQAAWGTGKTTVGAFILSKNLPADGEGCVVATATTNGAVAAFATALANLNDPNLRVVRFVSESAQQGELVKTPFDVDELLMRIGVAIGQDVMSDEELQFAREFRKKRGQMQSILEQGETLDEETRDEYLLSEEKVSETLTQMMILLKEHYKPNVWCTTTASLMNLTAPKRLLVDEKEKFEFIVMDECSQVPESVLVTMLTRFSRSRFLLIGDVKQLQPHVKIDRDLIITRLGAKGSMEVVILANGIPVATLVTSFRSHPGLVDLSNQLFYENNLIGGAPKETKILLLEAFNKDSNTIPFFYLHVAGKSIVAASKSLYNEAERTQCLKVVSFLLTKFAAKQITVITFYKQQLRRLEKDAAAIGFEIATVDSVQGRENEVIILLTTRSEFGATQSSFISEKHRLNVALTRCKQGMILLGDMVQLRNVPLWKEVCQWATTNGHELHEKDLENKSLLPSSQMV